MKYRSSESPMLTSSDVAFFLNVHINTVRRWANSGKLKVYRIGNRRDRRFQKKDIISFINTQSGEITAKDLAISSTSSRNTRN